MKTPIKDGDEIGILWTGSDGNFQIEFGLRFTRAFIENTEEILSDKEDVLDRFEEEDFYDECSDDNNGFSLRDVDDDDHHLKLGSPPLHPKKKAKHLIEEVHTR
jgi:hypothetical protein